MSTSLYWFRNDLRVADLHGLTQACKADRVRAIYFFDPRYFERDAHGFPRTGKFRARFLIETIEDLKKQLHGLGIPFFVYCDRPEDVLPGLIGHLGIDQLHSQREWTRDETRIGEALRNRLPDRVQWVEHFDQFLFHPDDIPFDSFGEIPEVFTAFRKACEKQAEVRECLPPPGKRPAAHWTEPHVHLPDLQGLGLEPFDPDPRSAFPFAGGSTAAWERLQSYFWEEKRLSYYKKTRNGLLGPEYSSKFSPWLANGALSAREVYQQVRRYEREVRRNQDTYWLIFELIWRDYFKYISLKHGNRIFQRSGIRRRSYKWGRSKTALEAWTRGRTANDFVNANMIELAQTGWMSNRGRQNVASYWSKELGQDWRIGAAWFESLLLDYDVHSNWGNWMYNSGVGNDPRDRKFNPSLQAERYDPGGRFRRLWLQPSLF